MRLLFITQKVDINDDVLGVYHEWIRTFAEKVESILVVCLFKGEHDLPDNVKVFSLGKEDKLKIFKKLKYCWNFYKYIWRLRKEYDKVFVHMNTEYIILGGLFWKLWKKKIGLWYAHGGVSLKLRIAEKLSDIIFTSTKSGFRLKSNKTRIVRQGIDVEVFKPQNQISNPKPKIFRIVTVGRISPVKDYETLINAVEIFKKEGEDLEVKIIGGVGLHEQEEYLNNLKKIIKEKKLEDIINFFGPVPYKDLAPYLQRADLFVNMSHTGSLDKVILEAMACGLPILSCNESLSEVLMNYQEKLMYPQRDFIKLAEKIKFIMNLDENEKEKMTKDLRNIVVENHSLNGLVGRIIDVYKKV